MNIKFHKSNVMKVLLKVTIVYNALQRWRN